MNDPDTTRKRVIERYLIQPERMALLNARTGMVWRELFTRALAPASGRE